MIILPVLRQKYNGYEPIIRATADKAKATLQNYCDDHGYAFMSRIKTIQSLAEKIETGRFEKWSDLDDLFACTVIVPTLSQEDAVIAFCKSAFNVKKIIKRGQVQKSPDVFRFESTRICAQIHQSKGSEIVEKPSIYDIVFEIQVKTAFEHAWSVSTHDLVYKASDIDWGRLRLAAQIKATVEQLDTLILTFDEAFKNVSKNKWPDVDNKKKIFTKMEEFKQKGYIPTECLPKDLSRFCDNLYKLFSDEKDAAGEPKKDVTGMPIKDVNSSLKAIEDELSHLSDDLFPRSISLLQYFLAILFKKGLLTQNKANYYHITDEILQLYPAMQTLNLRFNYEV
jgi:ppGpp synthetase/RelA/SpoT-type nucleotidyltranferase